MCHTSIGHLLQRKFTNNLKDLKILQVLNVYYTFQNGWRHSKLDHQGLSSKFGWVTNQFPTHK